MTASRASLRARARRPCARRSLRRAARVRLEADRADEARLRRAEQVAGAANLEVAHRDLQPAAEVRELADRFEPRLRVFGQRLVRLVEQERVRLVVRAPDAAAQLVELREAELVGVVDDDRVDVGNVDPVLDDRRRDEHVDLAVDEARHDRLELVLAHLPVADRDARLRHQLLERARDAVDRLDAVVHVVHLAAAVELGGDRALHDRVATPARRPS